MSENEPARQEPPLTRERLLVDMIMFDADCGDGDYRTRIPADGSSHPPEVVSGEVIYDLRPENEGPVVKFIEESTK
ncbi:MAG: hypothetical protein WD467_00230 [Candidatus Saccharimonadales bacterium]